MTAPDRPEAPMTDERLRRDVEGELADLRAYRSRFIERLSKFLATVQVEAGDDFAGVLDGINRLADQRDAALAERDQLRAEVERLRQIVQQEPMGFVVLDGDKYDYRFFSDRGWATDYIADLCLEEGEPEPEIVELIPRQLLEPKEGRDG